jgi:HEPN domain-containing protein
MTPHAEEAGRLLRLAKRDQGTFSLLLSLPQSELSALGFHAQQSAEKALKAVTVHAALTVPRTHDLVALGSLLTDSGVDLPLSADELRLLNPFAVEFCYDDEIVALVTRDQLAGMLAAILEWAAACINRVADVPE